MFRISQCFKFWLLLGSMKIKINGLKDRQNEKEITLNFARQSDSAKQG